jgi:hypothetical protein
MLNRVFVCHSETHYLLNIQIWFHLIFLAEFASIDQTEKPSCHELIFNISMKILIFWVFALHGTLERLFFLPLANTVWAEGRLAGVAFLRIMKNLKTNGTLKVSIILLKNSYRLDTFVIFQNLFGFNQTSWRKFFCIQLILWTIYWILLWTIYWILLRLWVALWRRWIIWPHLIILFSKSLNKPNHLLQVTW